ncbi:primary-amine oxidase [Acinetobacter rudis]|uniref:Amine oxidase n=1 Tax=Acinetobacter rudis CIP 110305 TaxID=421052 RepID=S3NJE5_9GAMM|nr:primary-amine oxidase [Acinetobacter rudis]EPF79767.1 primary-amine oxidase [Acinetobacter rudis CIP 110305]
MKLNTLMNGIKLNTQLKAYLLSLPMLMMGQQALAHGQAAEMLPLQQAMQAVGATVEHDRYSGIYTISKNSTYVKVKADAASILVNGQPLNITVPVIEKNGQAYASSTLANEIFQSGLDQTFVAETVPHPLNSLSANEISQVRAIVAADRRAPKLLRFSRLALKAPDKYQVWNDVLANKPSKQLREANFSLLQGNQIIEGVVNLKTNKVTEWRVIKDTHGMVLLDDFELVQKVIKESPEFAAALKKRGISDPNKVVATPLTVGYFGGEDGLSKEFNYLKIVSYLDVGDGNYWAHPIENLVAVVDLDQKKVVKVEDGDLVPIPMAARPYDGRDRQVSKTKPLRITEPEGKNFQVSGQYVHWNNWCFHVALDSRVGLQLSTVSYKDKGVKRKIMYSGNLGGMIVPYGDPDLGWYFKSYLDSGDYGMGTLTASLDRGTDVPENAVMFDAVIADYQGNPMTIPRAFAIFERYANPDYKHQEMGQANVSVARRELVVRWVSTIGNYDYIFDWVLAENGTIGINAGASGIEAVKGVKAKTMHDLTAKEDTRYGTLIDHNIVGTTHQHIYNFRLDLDVDGDKNSFTHMNPVVNRNDKGIRKSAMEIETSKVTTEQAASEKFDPSTIRLISNDNVENAMGNPVSYQLIPFAGGTHPIAKGANFSADEWLFKRLNFMDKQIWVTKYNPNELYPDGEYPNRSSHDTGLGQFTGNNDNIENQDLVVWLTTGTTHVARSEEWPMMPTEWVNVLLKPWNFFDQTPSLKQNESNKSHH